MVKRGGTKRKIEMKKITCAASASTTLSKRRSGLYSKVSELCLLTDAQVAVLATPLSSNSNCSFFSFGHTSVDSIVTAFLKGERPVRVEATKREDDDIGICFARHQLGLPQWWDDDRLVRSNNLEELTGAINSVSRMLVNIEELRSGDALKHQAFANDENDEPLMNNNETTDQTLVMSDKTLNFRSDSQIPCIPDVPKLLNYVDDYNNNVMTEEQDQIMAICDSFSVPDKNHDNNSFCVPENHDNNNNPFCLDDEFDPDLGMTFTISELNAILDSTPPCKNDGTTQQTVAFDDAFLEKTTSHEQLQQTTTSAMNSVACADASWWNALDEDDNNYLRQLLQA